MTQISDMQDGIKLGFIGEIEKRSDILDRNAIWKRQQHIKYGGDLVVVAEAFIPSFLPSPCVLLCRFALLCFVYSLPVFC